MEITSRLWAEFYKQLDEIDRNNPMDNLIVRKTMTPSKYPERAKPIAERLNANDSVLEIGCGYGGLALEILKLVPVKYTVVDTSSMLAQTRKSLGDKVKYVCATDIKTLSKCQFTLFISHFCLSETPYEYRKYILENIIKNCKNISVFDYDDMARPTPQMIADGYEMNPTITEYYLNKYFIVAKVRDTNAGAQFQFTGERKK